MALNRELMLELITALESGDYKKGKGCLRTEDDRYCCLGVVCDLMAKKNHGEWANLVKCDNDYMPDVRRNYTYKDIDSNESNESYLTESIWLKTGMSLEFMHSLASCNDISDTFEPVIAAIKAKLEEEANA